MIILESLAALVTICGGIVAALFWFFSKLYALRRENDTLRARLAELENGPSQPEGREYLTDADGTPICIRCYSGSRNRWKLVPDGSHFRCPVCDKTVAR